MGIYGKENDWLIFVTDWRGLEWRLKSVTTKMAQSTTVVLITILIPVLQ